MLFGALHCTVPAQPKDELKQKNEDEDNSNSRRRCRRNSFQTDANAGKLAPAVSEFVATSLSPGRRQLVAAEKACTLSAIKLSTDNALHIESSQQETLRND